jgi:hypothetical protein
MCNQLHRFQMKDGTPSIGVLAGDKGQVVDLSKALSDCEQLLETRFFRHCFSSIPFQRHTLQIGRIMLAKLSVIAKYPLFHTLRSRSEVTKEMETSTFKLCCDIIEWSHALSQDPETTAWSWMHQTYVHWHSAAFLLKYICMNPNDATGHSRAWEAINTTMQDPHGLSPTENQEIWQPLQSLYQAAKVITLNARNSKAIQDSPTISPPEGSTTSNDYSEWLQEVGMTGEGHPEHYPDPFETQPFTTIDDFMVDLMGTGMQDNTTSGWPIDAPDQTFQYNNLDLSI